MSRESAASHAVENASSLEAGGVRNQEGEQGSFRHEAFIHSGLDEFVKGTSAFVRAGLERGEPTLVIVSAAKIRLLREQLGADADRVQFADMADVGGNP